MRVKDFLRGFSVGIILTSGILFIVFKGSNQISDEYVIERAKQLDMVFLEESSFLKEDPANKNSDSKATVEDENTVTEDDTKSSSNEGSEQNVTSETQNLNSEEATMNSEEKDSGNKDTQQDSSASEQEEKTVTIQITKGMYSSDVSSILLDLNIIEDKQEFNLYLHNNGYSSKIKIGEFVIPVDASYEEIAKIITNS